MQHLILDNESRFAGSLPLAALCHGVNHVLSAIGWQNEEDAHQMRKIINSNVDKNNFMLIVISSF